MFQSTPARDGRRGCAESLGVPPSSFKPRPRATGDDPFGGSALGLFCFNQRPRATGDLQADAVRATTDGVSIDARARRATNTVDIVIQTRDVSIHARARRATPATSYCFELV